MRRRVSLYILVSTLLIIFLNFAVLVSWQLALPDRRETISSPTNVNPLSAIVFILIGCWILIKNRERENQYRTILFGLSIAIIGIEVVKLLQLLSLHHFHIDRVFFQSKVANHDMSGVALFNFFLLSIPLLFRNRSEKRIHLFNYCSLAVMFISLLVIITYVINEPGISRIEPHIPMALYSAISFFLISIAAILVEIEKSFLRTFFSSRMGGTSARKIFLAAAMLPIILTYLRTTFQKAGWYSESLGIALHDVLIIFILLTILWNTTRSLNRMDKQRSIAEDDLQKKSDNLLVLVEELKEKSQILNGIIKNIAVIVYRIDSNGYVTESIGSGLKLLGLKDKEAIGMYAYDAYPDFKAKVKEAIEKGICVTEYGMEINGNKVFFETHIFPDDLHAGGALCFSIDITEKKKVEMVLQDAKQNAEAASHFKTRFLANMSHEIRTPLNAILGFAEIMRSSDLAKEKQVEYLNHIESSGSMLLKLIGDVLDLSKIEEGKLSVTNEPFAFAETIQSTVRPYKFQANEKGLDFSLLMDPDIPANLVGDAHRINQIVVNLLGNAMKFTKEGKISLTVSQRPSPANDKDKAFIHFQIQDTGIGIPTEKQATIFESFTQADSSVVREYGGSGLGLSIVKQLIKLMGGSISVKTPEIKISEKGGPGSMFEFILPLSIDRTSAADQPGVIKNIDDDKLVGLKVLVAEDNLLNQKLANHMLGKMGCCITIAANGREAVEKLIEEDFDLVLMDVQMPVMDGLKATEIIRKELKQALPIVGLTANVFKDDIENCLASGMNDHLGKPYTEAQLREKVAKWCVQKETPAGKIEQSYQ